MQLTEKRNIVSLNYMRGIVAFLVMLGHANLLFDKHFLHGIFVQGWCGVDFFFVLSGFLLLYNYKEERRDLQYAMSYLKKRFLRIYPAYWLYTCIVILAAVAIRFVCAGNIITWNSLNMSDIFKSFALISMSEGMPVIPTAWTLPYEVFFYIVSLSLIIGGIRVYKYVLMFWSAMIITFKILSIDSSFTAFIFDPIFFEFFMGVISALLIRKGLKLSRKRALYMLGLGGGMLIVSWLGNNLEISTITQISREIAFGVPFTLILNGLVHYEFNIREVRKLNILQHLGESSYSLYLTHFLTIVMIIDICPYVINNCPQWIGFVLIVIVCMIVSEFAYLLIEKNVVKAGKKLFKLS